MSEAPPPRDPLVGTTVDGRYTIERPLASGGMGSVYLARQKNLARLVAVKVVTNADADLVERFRREAEALAEVAHPAIVEVHDFIRAEEGEGRCYLVMSYVEGENLEEYLDRMPGRAVSPAEAVALMSPIVSALVQLHASGIVHRDIKPANIIRFEGADGRPAVKLVDFGIARRAVDTSLTNAGYIIGTPPYMAPETLMAKPHTPLADVYALGATLHELVTGAPPHGQGPLHEIIKRAIGEPVLPPLSLEGTTLGWLLGQMLERDEERRPDALQVLNGLERVRDELAAQRVASGGMAVVTGSGPAPVFGGVSGPGWPTGQASPLVSEPSRLAPTVQLPDRAGAGSGPSSGPLPSGQRTAAPRLPGTLATDPGRAVTVAATRNTGGAPAAGPPQPQATGQAWNSVTAPTEVRRASVWLWLGPLIGVPVLVGVISLTLVLGREGSGGQGAPPDSAGMGSRASSSGEKPHGVTDAAPPRRAGDRDAASPRRAGDRDAAPPRRAGDPDAAPPRRAGDPDAGPRTPSESPWTVTKLKELVASCQTPKDASRLFAEAKKAETSTEPEDWKKAVAHYRAVLQCAYSSTGQRIWSARLIANIYRRLPDCRASRQSWTTYQQLSRRAGKVPKPFPRCPP